MPSGAPPGTEVNFRLCLHLLGLSLCGFRLRQNQANHKRRMRCISHLCVSHASLDSSFKLRVVLSRPLAGNKSTRVLIPQRSFSSLVATTVPCVTDTFVRSHLSVFQASEQPELRRQQRSFSTGMTSARLMLVTIEPEAERFHHYNLRPP